MSPKRAASGHMVLGILILAVFLSGAVRFFGQSQSVSGALYLVAGLAVLWVLWKGREEPQQDPDNDRPSRSYFSSARPRTAEEPTPVAAPTAVADEPVAVGAIAAPPVPAAPVAATKPDDLKKIEGIGPKIAGLLVEAGVSTFAELAASDSDRLQSILDRAGRRYRLADPSTWPEQAALAAAGDWARLAELQNELKGGRRVP